MPPTQLKRKIGPCDEGGGNDPGERALVGRGRDPHHRIASEAARVHNYFDDSDVVATNVLRFLGVRSLVNFGATGKSNRIAMLVEIERRKKHIADTEIEVARLMSDQHQSPILSAYIRKKLQFYFARNGEEPEDQAGTYEDSHKFDLSEDDYYEVKDLYSLVMYECGGEQIRLNNLRHVDFIAAKKLVYNAMRLIDDEIGIFYATENSDTLIDEDGQVSIHTNYFDVQEDDPTDNDSEYNQTGRLSDDVPGDDIHLFRKEREKFFSLATRRQIINEGPGSLFILPKCFLIPPEIVRDVGSVPIECIRAAIRAIDCAMFNFRMGQPCDWNLFTNTLHKNTALRNENIEAFRVVAREEFFFEQNCFFHREKMIKLADEYIADDTHENIGDDYNYNDSDGDSSDDDKFSFEANDGEDSEDEEESDHSYHSESSSGDFGF
jgi:hypothetical protein